MARRRQPKALVFPFADQQNFVNAFLNVVFTEHPLPALHRLNHRIGTEGLGHGQQAHAGGVASGGGTGRGNTVTDKLELANNHGHNPTVNF